MKLLYNDLLNMLVANALKFDENDSINKLYLCTKLTTKI